MGSRGTKVLFLCIKQYRDPYYQGIAAQLAFFFMLSIVPTMIVLSQMLGILDISLDFLQDWIKQYVDSEMADALLYLVDYKSVTTTNVFLILMAIWAASRIHFSLMRVTNYTYSDGADSGHFWKERARSIITLVITLLAMAFMILVLIYGETIFHSVLGIVFDASALDVFFDMFKWPMAAAIYFLMVSLNYYLLPRVKKKYKDIMPGSVFSSIGMMVVTVGYSIYASHAVNYDLIYGSLASIVALMFWLYFISWVLCLGILVNKAWEDTK